MSKEQDIEFEKYYNDMQDLFQSSGWVSLHKDFTATAMNLNMTEGVKDAEDLWFKKGQLNILANLLNLESQLEAMRVQQDEDEAQRSSL